MARNNKQAAANMSWARVIRDLGLKAIDKGQVVSVTFSIFLIVTAARITPEKLYLLSDKVIDGLLEGYLSLTVVLVLVIAAWGFHVKVIRTAHSKECDRLGTDKSKLQNQSTKLNLNSSNDT
jgi:hypothetical protein